MIPTRPACNRPNRICFLAYCETSCETRRRNREQIRQDTAHARSRAVTSHAQRRTHREREWWCAASCGLSGRRQLSLPHAQIDYHARPPRATPPSLRCLAHCSCTVAGAKVGRLPRYVSGRARAAIVSNAAPACANGAVVKSSLRDQGCRGRHVPSNLARRRKEQTALERLPLSKCRPACLAPRASMLPQMCHEWEGSSSSSAAVPGGC